MIKFKNVTKIYKPDIIALENVSFKINEGEFVSIVGRSGAGKTTLVRLLLVLEKPNLGEVFYKDMNVHNLKPSKISNLRRKIGVAYQDYRLMGSKTIFENISYILKVKGMKGGEIKKDVSKILEFTGLEKRAESFPDQLSGGEQQRVVIARALVNDPEVIIADEPTGNLDPYNTYDVISLLKEVNQEGKTVILLTHDKEIINNLKRRVITLEDGKIIRDDKEGEFII